MADLAITPGRSNDIPLLEPLWLAVHEAHQQAMPELAPYVSDEQSWQQRRQLYTELLARPAAFLLLAGFGAELAGYALGYVRNDTDDDWVSDTWDLDGPIGELESLSVLPVHRRKGVGGALLTAADLEFTRLGVRNQILGMLPGNSTAMRVYQRHGYRPTWVYLSRFNHD